MQAFGRAVLRTACGWMVVGAMTGAGAQERGGPPMPPPGPGGGPAMMFGGSPERAVRGLDRMMDGLGVTDEQRARVRQIALAAAADLRPQRQAERDLREKGMQLFSAPVVDASAVEALRLQANAAHDQQSQRIMVAMLDIANVLTPRQRARIAERMQERQAVMSDRMRRMPHDDRGQMLPPGAPK